VGRTTCANYVPGESRFVFASTHLDDFDCPSRPPLNLGYVWPLYAGYELFLAEADGSDFRRLTETGGYDAEVSISPDGSSLVFTSTSSPQRFHSKAGQSSAPTERNWSLSPIETPASR
jgi:dipeptidyl aminopeptidase/acylaminoacyl peptidase